MAQQVPPGATSPTSKRLEQGERKLHVSALKLPNVLPFLVFRVFFNARFYYPIFAVLFLDFGLTLAQFSLSNLIWAISIVLLEVPSGALADVLGRKKLVVAAALLMLMELGVLLIAQPEPSTALLVLFCLNRLLSGAAEAMASGADEALVYDSLCEAGHKDQWAGVLELQTKLRSIAFFTVMLVGAAVYDPELMTKASSLLGWEHTWTKAETLKLPIWLTLAGGVLALLGALALKPLESESQEKNPWGKVLQVGKRILGYRELAAVIFATVLFDQVARVSLTLGSQTFLTLGIQERWFGVIGAGFALLGAFLARPARLMAERKSQQFAFWVLTVLLLAGLCGQAILPGLIGLLFVAILSGSMNLVGFFSSYHINQLARSEERATTLSFKGLGLNVAFGAVSLYYAGVAGLMEQAGYQYQQTLLSLPAYFVACLILYLIWYRRG